MTILKPEDDQGGDGRIRRPTPDRAGPNRTAAPPAAAVDPPSAPTSGPTSPSADDGASADKAPLSDAVAEAVKRGYKVIGENIQQGRLAAEHFRNGQYNIRDASYDLNQMSLRMLSLAREISDTTCDILERLLRDPKIVGASSPDPSAPARSYRPPPFRAAPPPPGTAGGGVGPGVAAAPPPSGPVPLQVVFDGAPAKVTAATLDRPPTPTALANPILKGLDPALPAIADVSFWQSEDPLVLKVMVKIPAGQPAGVYSGLICAEGSQVPLGLLTIEVAG